jgi:hypothetical protein
MTIGWTNGNGANRAVFVKETTGAITNPIDGTAYTASADWSNKETQLGTSGYYCVYNGTGSSVTLTNLAENTEYFVYVYEYNGSGTSANYLVTVPLNGSESTIASGSPSLTVSSAGLEFFGNIGVGSESSQKNFTVSGSNLDGTDITISCPTDFQISQTVGSGYSTDPITLSYSGTDLTETTIYVKFIPVTTGNKSVTIDISGGSADAKTVSVSGFGLSAEPTTQATVATATAASSTTMNINWANGNGGNRIVLMKAGSAVDALPVDATTYSGNLAFGSGSQIGTGNFVIFAGSGSGPIQVTNLIGATTYYVAIFEYNTSVGGTENYLTSSPTTSSASTPGITVGALTGAPFCVDESNSAAGTIEFTLTGTFDAGNDFTAWLSDFAGSFDTETQIGSLDNTNTAGTINISIPAGTATGSGYKLRIKSNNPAAISNETSTFVINNGISNVSGVSASNGNAKSVLTWTNPTNCFDEILIVAKAESAVGTTPSGDGSDYTGSLTFGSGTAFDGGFVVYKGSASPQTITALTNGTTYHFKLFTRRGTNWSDGVSTTATPVSQLEAGDIAFTALQVDDADQIAFVALVDIPASSVIYFTDNAWTGSVLNSNEGIITWTAPGTTVAKGTIVTITGTTSASAGTASGTGSYALSSSGDQMLAYTGSSGSPNFIAGISTTSWLASGTPNTNTSYLPSALTLYNTAQGFVTDSDNQYFTNVTNQGSRNSFLSAINNNAGWTRSDTRYGSLPSWTFTFGNSASSPTVPSGSNVSVNTIGNIGISNITFGEVSTGGTVTVDRFDNSPADHGLDGNVSGYRFIIEPDNSLVFTQATGYTLRFDLADIWNHGIAELANGDNTSVKLYKRETPGVGAPTGPINMTYSRNGTDGNQADDYLVSEVIIDGFSEFFFQSPSQPLPVELTSFTAKATGNAVNLNWETATEVDNNGFDVERNSAGTWQKIGFVEGHGTANSPKYYTFTDKSVTGNKIQYRLRQVDNDGTFEYSNVVEVELAPTTFTLDQNYPNPFNPTTMIRFSLPTASVVTLNVYNTLGEKVVTLLNGQMESGYHQVSFDAANLPSGLYLYEIKAGEFSSIKKMVLLK